jgi:hypothetical protein
MDEPLLIALGPCVACARMFTFDPDRVPSVLYEGERWPVCPDCLERLNEMRRARGLEAHRPAAGAYGPGA